MYYTFKSVHHEDEENGFLIVNVDMHDGDKSLREIPVPVKKSDFKHKDGSDINVGEDVTGRIVFARLDHDKQEVLGMHEHHELSEEELEQVAGGGFWGSISKGVKSAGSTITSGVSTSATWVADTAEDVVEPLDLENTGTKKHRPNLWKFFTEPFV